MGRDLSIDPFGPRGPRWGTDRPLATRITQRGRWRKVDPLRVGRAPTVWEVLGYAAWVGLLVGSLRKAQQRAAATGQSPDPEQNG